MEVRYDEVCVLKLDIRGRCSQEDSAQAAADKHRHKSNRKQSCGSKPNSRSPYCAEPVECLNCGRHCDQQCCQCKNRSEERVHAADEHVVAPHDEAQH